jgi:NAD(P)-dependent dehydrogenase (short-subunit alcohol dehydrogenase family)
MKLQGKVVFVSGANGDIGPSICKRLAKEGASVVCVARNGDNLNALAGKIRNDGGKALPVVADVTDINSVRKAVQAAKNAFGRIDMLVTNAGGTLKPYNTSPNDTQFKDMEFAECIEVIKLNLFGVMICAREIIGSVIEAGKGKFVFVSSIDGLRGANGKADYAASKAGIIAFGKSLAQELAPYHIHVNTVALGQISNGREKDNSNPDSWTRFGKGALLKRFGEPEEAASLIAFLLSDEADYITGENYLMGGGVYL